MILGRCSSASTIFGVARPPFRGGRRRGSGTFSGNLPSAPSAATAGREKGHVAVARACSAVESRLGEQLHLKDIALSVGVSVSHLNRLFRTHFDETVTEYVRRRRWNERGILLLLLGPFDQAGRPRSRTLEPSTLQQGHQAHLWRLSACSEAERPAASDISRGRFPVLSNSASDVAGVDGANRHRHPDRAEVA